MSSACLVALVLAAPPTDPTTAGGDVESASPPVPVAADSRTERTQKERLRAAYLKVMRASAKRARPDPAEVVPDLVSLYGILDDVDGLSHAERSRMRRGLESRLARLQKRLVRGVVQFRRKARRARLRAAHRGRRPPSAKSLAGGAEARRAMQLINLIRKTVAPESWSVRGGNGSISYFPLTHALVIRQTGEVHHQIGGALEQLRK